MCCQTLRPDVKNPMWHDVAVLDSIGEATRQSCRMAARPLSGMAVDGLYCYLHSLVAVGNNRGDLGTLDQLHLHRTYQPENRRRNMWSTAAERGKVYGPRKHLSSEGEERHEIIRWSSGRKDDANGPDPARQKRGRHRCGTFCILRPVLSFYRDRISFYGSMILFDG